MKTEPDLAFVERLKKALGGESIAAFSKGSGVSATSLAGYLRGENEPSRLIINKISVASHVNIAWLSIGEGPMRPGDAGPPSAVQDALTIDPVLFGRCLDAITKLFQELSIKAPPTTLGEEAALIYQDVAASRLESLDEQLTAIRVIVTQRRRALLAASPGKHQGSA